MILRRRSWLVRWYFSSLNSYARCRVERDGTTLCGFVNRVFWTGLLAAVVSAVIATMGFLLAVLAITEWRKVLPAVAFFGVAAVFLTGIYWIIRGVSTGWERLEQTSPTAQVTVGWLRAKKARVCPPVTFEG